MLTANRHQMFQIKLHLSSLHKTSNEQYDQTYECPLRSPELVAPASGGSSKIPRVKWVLDGDESNDYRVVTLYKVITQAKTKTTINKLLDHHKQDK